MTKRGRSEAALCELGGEFSYNSFGLQVCILLLQIGGAHYKEPARAVGIPLARGTSRCKSDGARASVRRGPRQWKQPPGSLSPKDREVLPLTHFSPLQSRIRGGFL